MTADPLEEAHRLMVRMLVAAGSVDPDALRQVSREVVDADLAREVIMVQALLGDWLVTYIARLRLVEPSVLRDELVAQLQPIPDAALEELHADIALYLS